MENSFNQFPSYSCTVQKAATPDFKTRIAQGSPLPENPYSLVIYRSPNVKVRQIVGYAQGKPQDYGEILQNLGNNLGYADRTRRSMESAWLARLNNKILEKIKAMSLPVIQLYVERKRTASALAKLVDDSIFIARNVKRPRKIFRKFSKSTNTKQYRKVRNSVRLLASRNSTVGDAWLQYRMFLTPLYHDVMSSLNASADYEKKSHPTQVKSKVQFQEHLDFANDTYSLLLPSNWMKGIISVEGGASMRIRYTISDHSLVAITSLTDPLAVGWDLVPWSFIVDRFIDLGSYLELRNATLGTDFKSGSLSYLFEWKAVPVTPWVTTYYPNAALWSTNGYKMELVGMENTTFSEISTGRIILKSFPPVQLEYPFNQGWKQVTDEIVLLRQLLGRRLR